MLYYDDEHQDEDHVNSKRHAREGMRKKSQQQQMPALLKSLAILQSFVCMQQGRKKN